MDRRVAFLICVVLVVVSRFHVTASAEGKHGNAFSRNAKESTHTSREHGDGDKPAVRDDSDERSSGVDEGDKSAALNRFLENVLKARNELKWIDQVARNVDRENAWRKSPYSESLYLEETPSRTGIDYGNKLRDKRGFGQNYETAWLGQRRKHEDNNSPDIPRRTYLDNDILFRRNADRVNLDNLESSRNRVSGKEIHSPLERRLDRPVYEKGTMDDRALKDWTVAEDLRSSSDCLNSNKNLEPEMDKREDRWIRAYGATQKPRAGSELEAREKKKKKEVPLSFESLKETVLELKKSLTGGEKKFHGNAKNLDTERDKDNDGYADAGEDSREEKNRRKSKHRRSEVFDSDWRGNSKPESESFDVRNSVRTPGDRESIDDPENLWRTKRTEVNIDRDKGTPKLFYRAGFGAAYPEEKSLEHPHDRERRSEGSSPEEKRNSNEPDGGTKPKNDDTPADRATISKETNSNDPRDPEKKDSPCDDPRGRNIGAERNGMANDAEEGVLKKITDIRDEGNAKESESNERSDSSSKDPRENEWNGVRSTKSEGKATDLEGNSLRTLGFPGNELQAGSAKTFAGGGGRAEEEVEAEKAAEARIQKTEEKEGNVGSSQAEQVIKVFEPQGHLYQNSRSTKEVERIGGDGEERGKLSRQLAEEKRAKEEPRDINILAESENKNMIKFSNSGIDERAAGKDAKPLTVNTFDVKKKLILEKEDGPGKSVSTFLDVKIAKARVDSSPGNVGKASSGEASDKLRSEYRRNILNLETNKPNEELNRDASGLARDLEQRNANEERLENTAVFDKGLPPSVDNGGSRDWYEDVANVDQSASRNYNDDRRDNGKGRFKDDAILFREEGKKFNSVEDVPDAREKRDLATENRESSEGYGGRKLLDYVEYSNSEAEDVDPNYSDKEEGDEREQDRNGNVDRSKANREQRSPSGQKSDPVKARVNILIQQKLSRKNKKTGDNMRMRREPTNIIEYYDYDSDVEQRDQDAPFVNSEQERDKNHRDQGSTDTRLKTEHRGEPKTCVPAVKKKNEHEEIMLKEEKEKEKLKNKEPKEEFIVDLGQPRNVTTKSGKPSNSSRSSSKVKLYGEEGLSGYRQPGRLDQGEDNVNSVNRGRLSEQVEEKSLSRGEKYPNDGGRETMLKKPMEYILNLRKSFEPEPVDDFFEDIQPIGGRKEKNIDNIEPLCDELKKFDEWSDELKIRSPFKEDHRTYINADDKSEIIRTNSEGIKDRDDPLKNTMLVESPMSDSSPSLPQLLLFYNGSGKSEIGENALIVLSDQAGIPDPNNASRNNYVALKSTDDLFKGGTDQNLDKTVADWKAEKILPNPSRDDSAKDGTNLSSVERKEIVDVDPCSQCENCKPFRPQSPNEQNRNIDYEKQVAIGSNDFQESFVEPLDFVDDFDKDIRVRLSRSLKTVEDMNLKFPNKEDANVLTNATNHANSKCANASGRSKVPDNKTKTYLNSDKGIEETSENVEKSFKGENFRVRREIGFPYRSFNDYTNQNQPDDGIDYSQYLINDRTMNNMDNRLQFPSSYENVDRSNDRSLDPNWRDVPEYDFFPLGKQNPGNYRKTIRSINERKKRKHGRKKNHFGRTRKQSKKGHASSSKYSPSKNFRKRRHHKHSKSKDKNGNRRKQKKHASKHSNMKKSHTTEEEKVRETHREKSKYGPSINERRAFHANGEDEGPDEDSQRRKITLLLTTDNIEDESQINSALHGELAGKIIDQIFEQVQKNENLKVSFGPGLYQKHKPEDAITADKTYHRSLNENEVKHTEELLKKVMELIHRLIFEEVQRKTCVSLTPDMTEFLNWMLDVDPQDNFLQETPTLPLVLDKDAQDHRPQDKFLFHGSPDQELQADLNELYKKIHVMKSLIKEYNALTETEKIKVQSVHDYLVKQLDLLVEYLEAMQQAENKERSLSRFGAAKGINGGIILYQAATNNATNGNYSTAGDTFSPIINVPKLLNLRNDSFGIGDEYLSHNGLDSHQKRQRKIRSLEKSSGHRRKRKKGKGKHRKHHKSGSNIDRSSHRKNSVHKGAMLRRKRAYANDDIWDPFDSGYEGPLTYISADTTGADSKENNGELLNEDRSRERNAENSKRENDLLYARIEENASGAWKFMDGKRDAPKSGFNLRSLANSRDENEFEEDHENTDKETRELPAQSDSSIVDGMEPDELPIKGQNQVEDELMLLNKRQAWKKENEEQLEEVAFGKDMRSRLKEKELFERLTELDKKKDTGESSARERRRDVKTENASTNGIESKNHPMRIDVASTHRTLDDFNLNNSDASCRSNGNDSSSNNKLRMLEAKINVYSDNERDTARVRKETRTAVQKVNAEEIAAVDEEVGKCTEDKLAAINSERKLNGIKKTSRSERNIHLTYPRLGGRERGTRIDYEMELQNLKGTR